MDNCDGGLASHNEEAKNVGACGAHTGLNAWTALASSPGDMNQASPNAVRGEGGGGGGGRRSPNGMVERSVAVSVQAVCVLGWVGGMHVGG